MFLRIAEDPRDHAWTNGGERAGRGGSAPLVAMLLDNHHGPDRRVEMETKMLARHNLRVRVLAWDRRSPEEASRATEPERPAGEEVVRLAVPAPPVGVRSLLRVAELARHVWPRSRELLAEASVLIVHDLYLLPLGRALGLRHGLPVVYDAHEEFAAMEGARYPGWLLRLVTAVETRLARGSALVVVPGETRVPRWRDAGIEPLVVPNLGREDELLPRRPARWDLGYCGSLAEMRRLDLLVELARRRPDLRLVVAGQGRSAEWLAGVAAELENLEFLGETGDPDAVLAQSRAVFYGLDPRHPYADKSCPNTLYQAIRVQRPLVTFGGGEIDRVMRQHRIGVRCTPAPDSLAGALDGLDADGWDFEAAWAAVRAAQTSNELGRRVESLAGVRTTR